MPSLWNIGALLFVVFFIYGVLGIDLFGTVPYTDGGLSKYANFTNIGYAFLTLFRVATADDWEDIKNGTYLSQNECQGATNCGSILSPIFFVSFYIIGASVM